nr:leucine zipper domain-containing protein [Streptomyces sp. AC602_WCS936]
MTHANALLTIKGRRRLLERCRTRPIAHVAAEAGVSRAPHVQVENRYDTHAEAGLRDRPPERPAVPELLEGAALAPVEEHRVVADRPVGQVLQARVGLDAAGRTG